MVPIELENFEMLHTCSDQLDILAFWAYHPAYLDPKMQKQKQKKNKNKMITHLLL